MELPANTIVIFIVATCVLLAVLYFFFFTNQKMVPPIIQASNDTGARLQNQTQQILNMTKTETTLLIEGVSELTLLDKNVL